MTIPTPWPTGTGLLWYESGRLYTTRWPGSFHVTIPSSSPGNSKVIALLQANGATQVPFSVSAGLPSAGSGASGTGTGAGARGTGTGSATRPAVPGTPPKVAADAATLKKLAQNGTMSQTQADAFGKGLAAAAGLTDAQRQELLGIIVGDAASHEPPDMALTRAEVDRLFDFIRANPKLFKDLPENAPPLEREMRIKEITRLLDSLGKTLAVPPNVKDVGAGTGTGPGGGGLSPSDFQLLQDFKAKYGNPWDAEEPETSGPLTSTHKFRIALRLSTRWMPAGAAAELEAMLKNPWFWAGIVVGIGVYIALWVFPEPIISKSLAAGITIALLALFAVSEIIALAKAWTTLSDDAEHMISLADLEVAAEKFGRAVGASGARIIVTLAMILIGGKVLPKKLPPPPSGAPVAVQSIMWGTPTQGAAIRTVPVLVADWETAAAQAAWAIKVLNDGSVVIVASGSHIHMMASSGGGGAPGPPRAKGVAKPTGPTGGKPTGTPDPINPGDDAATVRSRMGERKAADVLADQGYPTEQQPTVTWGKNPDLKVSGYIFDVYSPAKGTRLANVWSTLADKFAAGQARRFVLFLDDWILGAGANRAAITDHIQKMARQLPGVEQILIVLKGKVYSIYP